MTATSVHRSPGIPTALLLAAGLAVLQALIGGRVLLFAYPGYFLIGTAALIGVATIARSNLRSDLFCLCATAVFCLYLGARAWFSPTYFARADLFAILGALVVYGLTTSVLNSSKARLVIVASLLVFALAHVLIGAMQFSRGDNFMLIPFLQRVDYGQRASGFFVCPNHLAGLLEVLAIFGVSLTCWGRWPIWGRILIGYTTAVCYVGVALTGSRGGYLSVIASLGGFVILSLVVIREARPGRLLKLIAVGTAILILVAISGAFLIRQNVFLSQRAGNIIDSKNIRIALWGAAVQQWKLDPFFGTGAGTYRFYGRQFRSEQMQNDPVDVHNDYLHLLCEYGIVGAVGFLLFCWAHLRHGWRNLRFLAWRSAGGGILFSNRLALAFGSLAAVAAYIVHSAVDFNLHIPANAMLLAFVFGILASRHGSHDSEARRPIWAMLPRVTTGAFGAILLIQCGRLLPGEYYAERARTALRDENPSASILFANKALYYESHNPELLLNLGRALVASAHQSGDVQNRVVCFEEAISAFKTAHALLPLDGTYPLSLAFTYDEIGRFEEAEVMYKAARSRDPRSKAVADLYQAHLESRARSDQRGAERL